MTSEVRATSFCELTELLFQDAWDATLERFRSPFVFRGLSCANYALETSLTRLGGTYDKVEGHLIRNFIKYARRSVEAADSIWHWLAIAQHHGLPIRRLLDWTFSPYVALHFATDNVARFNTDGVIWCVNYVITNNLIPDVLRELLAEEEGFLVFTAEMLAKASPFDHVQSHGGARPVALAASRGLSPHRRPGRTQMGGTRQARPDQHHRARVVSRPRRPEPVAEAIL